MADRIGYEGSRDLDAARTTSVRSARSSPRKRRARGRSVECARALASALAGGDGLHACELVRGLRVDDADSRVIVEKLRGDASALAGEWADARLSYERFLVASARAGRADLLSGACLSLAAAEQVLGRLDAARGALRTGLSVGWLGGRDEFSGLARARLLVEGSEIFIDLRGVYAPALDRLASLVGGLGTGEAYDGLLLAFSAATRAVERRARARSPDGAAAPPRRVRS